MQRRNDLLAIPAAVGLVAAVGLAGITACTRITINETTGSPTHRGSVPGPADDAAPDSADSGAGVVIGAAGGVVEADGIRITFPPNALARDVSVALTVDSANRVITVRPDLILLEPARVDTSVWGEFGAGDPVLTRAADDEWYENSVVEFEDGASFFTASDFSPKMLKKKNTVAGCWERRWTNETLHKGEKCAEVEVKATTLCGEVYPSVSELTASGAVNDEEVAHARAVAAGTRPALDGTRIVDVRRGRFSSWRVDKVSTAHGDCFSDADCGGRLGAAGRCVNGEKGSPSCEFVRSNDEPFLMHPSARFSLDTARSIVRDELPGFDLQINGALDSSGRFHSPGSLHYAGRAVDLSLCTDLKDEPGDPNVWPPTSVSNCTRKATQPELDANLPALPSILVRAGFSWVWYEDGRHVHASVRAAGCGYALPSRCACGGSPAGFDPSNGLCAVFAKLPGDNCPPCLPQRLHCDRGQPPVAGCIRNGGAGYRTNVAAGDDSEFCCPGLPPEFPCIRVTAGAATYRGDNPTCNESHPYAYSCAVETVAGCQSTGGGGGIGCGGTNYVHHACCGAP